ncbi:MAG: IS110 family transposase [Candidatus Korobacteraceae bacterium]|jgi:transposase
MWIIGCDYHPRFQQIAFVNSDTGEYGTARLEHADGEAERFYRRLVGQRVRVGIEASGQSLWFERLLGELGHELWTGDPAEIRAQMVRKQKTDSRDAEHILKLLWEERFPRVWRPSLVERDLRQLVLHRHRLVQMRTRVKNQLQALAMNQGLCQKKKLWSRAGRAELQALPLLPWAGRRRQELLQLHDQLCELGRPLDQAVRDQAAGEQVQRLMTHPGVGEVTALTFVLTIGDPQRFASGRHLASYLGLIPQEASSGGKQRLGRISKQGNALLRGLLAEAAHIAVRHEPELGRCWRRLAMKKNRQIATIAVARKLAVRLWWMWIRGLDYGAMFGSGSHAG